MSSENHSLTALSLRVSHLQTRRVNTSKLSVEPKHPKGAESEIMALGSHVSESFLAYQLHSVVKMERRTGTWELI